MRQIDACLVFRIDDGSGPRIDGDVNGDGVADDSDDTDNNGVVDENDTYVFDHNAAFDAQGKPVGITVRDAFAAIGLRHYIAQINPLTQQPEEFEEDGTTPADLSSLEKLRGSYSTTVGDDGVERIFRVRETANNESARKAWFLLLSQGDIDSNTDFNDRILKPGSEVRIAYVQDLDSDNLPANLEYLLGTIDSTADSYDDAPVGGWPSDPAYLREFGPGRKTEVLNGREVWQNISDGRPDNWDTDGDGIGDRVEALIGWTVDLGGRGSRNVLSSGSLADTDHDGVSDREEAPAPSAFEDFNGDGLVERFNPLLVARDTDFVTDPANPDTDGDGVARYIFRGPSDNTRGLKDDYVEIFGDLLSPAPNPDVPISGVHAGGAYRFELLYTGGGVKSTRSSPNLADTDGDGLADGVEVRFGLNPYVAGNKDSDRDGLPDEIETGGWNMAFRAVSTLPKQEGALVSIHVDSDPFNPDTDGDGLSDFLEFDLSSGLSVLPVHSNPRAKDTDGDGLTDRQELLGIVVRNLGIITLDPLDADSDNDLRSDGDEAEIVDIESKRWFVVAGGKSPYRVYSDPRFADADYHGLVDGEEYGDVTGDGQLDPRDFYNNDGRPDVGLYRIDPNTANTDGDKRNDGIEVRGGSNPLVADLRVTVVAQSIDISATGQFNYELSVQKPDQGSLAGLSPTETLVFGDNTDYTSNEVGLITIDRGGGYAGNVYFMYQIPNTNTWTSGEIGSESGTWDPGTKGVPHGAKFYPVLWVCCVGEQRTLDPPVIFTYVAGSQASAGIYSGGPAGNAYLRFSGLTAPLIKPQDSPFSSRSVSFGLAAGERFSVDGFFRVVGVSTTPTQTVQLGGLEGKKAKKEAPASSGTSTNGSSTTSSPTSVRPVFSYSEVSEKFIEDYYFEEIVGGITVTLKFYFIID